MAKKKSQTKPKKKVLIEDAVSLYSETAKLREQVAGLQTEKEDLERRIHESEVNLSLIIRLLTSICIEKLGMRIGVLKRLIKKAEEEAIRDSQIVELEALYKMPHKPKKKNPARKKLKDDPWDEIA